MVIVDEGRRNLAKSLRGAEARQVIVDELGRDEGPYGFRNAMTREVARKLGGAG